MQYFIKVIIILGLVLLVTELSKRNSTAAAILASLPITSLIAISWLKFENCETSIITNLCQEIFWMVLPSLVFFALFPYLLKQSYNFWGSFFISCIATSAAYALIIKALRSFSSIN